jgi:hypothetical protein
VVERAAAFADAPLFQNLVGIKAGRMTGNWRDSEQGLGRGRYAYDVNAALVPAALGAAARFAQSGVLDTFVDAGQRRKLARAAQYSRVWTARAPSLFAVDVPAARAREAVAAYAKEIGVDGAKVEREFESPLAFHALSLDDGGRPIPILHSDEGFRLLLTEPDSPGELERCLAAIMRPFPAGLVTHAGILVANPTFANADLRREFTRFAYHGTVVWSWQQALLASGLARQLRRANLTEPRRAQLLRARATVWSAIDRSAPMRTSELWSWAYEGGQFRIEPFGRRGVDADESNAAQLWSTVYLGLSHPL